MEILLVTLAGIFVGMAAGLLPALPVFTGPMIMYYFIGDSYPLEYMLIFWMASYSGTQFFGSIATITTGIPGEESSTIYLDDLKYLTHDAKQYLLYDTAKGSFIAGIISTIFVWAIVRFANPDIFPMLLSTPVQLCVYSLALMIFLYTGRNWSITLLLVGIGLIIGPHQNYALPEIWYEIQQVFNGLTIYMVVLGTIIIPTLFEKSQCSKIESFKASSKKSFSLFHAIKNSVLGAVVGLIPGPTASISATFAYKSAGDSKYNKILSAETANNAAVITCAIPFFILGLPINQNTLLMSSLLELQSINIIQAIVELGMFGIPVIDVLIITIICVLCVYFVLSIFLIDTYARIVLYFHSRIKWIIGVLLLGLISIDLQYAEITLIHYMIMLSGFTCLGMLLKKYNISAIPFLFAIILSDKVVWLAIQSIKIYF